VFPDQKGHATFLDKPAELRHMRMLSRGGRVSELQVLWAQPFFR